MTTTTATTTMLIPRVPHLPGSRLGNDDLRVDDERPWRAARVAIVEKLDGVGVALWRAGEIDDGGGSGIAIGMKTDWRRARQGALLRSARRWVDVHAATLRALLDDDDDGRVVLYAEWLWQRLVLPYRALPAAMVFHGVERGGALQSRLSSRPLLRDAGLATVEPCFVGKVGERAWSSLVPARSGFGARRAEGIIVERVVDGGARWAKWVAPHYRQPKGRDVTGALNTVIAPVCEYDGDKRSAR